MIIRLNRKQERLLLNACTLNEVFPILHKPLKEIQQEYDELSPVEVWLAAMDFSEKLLAMNDPELELSYLVEDLQEECETANGSFLVMLTSAYQLAPLRKKDKRVIPAIQALLPYYCDHPLYRDLILEIGNVEDERRMKKGCINLLEYQLHALPQLNNAETFEQQHKIMSEFADVACLCNCRVLANVINVFGEFNDQHQGRFADILDRMRKKQHELDQPKKEPSYTLVQKQEVMGDQNVLHDEAQLTKLGLPVDVLTYEKIMKLINNANSNQLTDGR